MFIKCLFIQCLFIQCLFVCEAPKGHRIRIDFSDDFYLEWSELCTYDFIELRDGPFGYSPLLGRSVNNYTHHSFIWSGLFQ